METGMRNKKRKEIVDNNQTVMLQDLLKYDRIVVQCHDVPDADALASGFALVRYFQSRGHEVSFIYGGRQKISKPNLLLMPEIQTSLAL